MSVGASDSFEEEFPDFEVWWAELCAVAGEKFFGIKPYSPESKGWFKFEGNKVAYIPYFAAKATPLEALIWFPLAPEVIQSLKQENTYYQNRRQAARDAFCKYAVLTTPAGDGLDAALAAWESFRPAPQPATSTPDPNSEPTQDAK